MSVCCQILFLSAYVLNGSVNSSTLNDVTAQNGATYPGLFREEWRLIQTLIGSMKMSKKESRPKSEEEVRLKSGEKIR